MKIPKDDLISLLALRLEKAEKAYKFKNAEDAAKWLIETGYVTQETMFEKEKEFRETGI